MRCAAFAKNRMTYAWILNYLIRNISHLSKYVLQSSLYAPMEKWNSVDKIIIIIQSSVETWLWKKEFSGNHRFTTGSSRLYSRLTYRSEFQFDTIFTFLRNLWFNDACGILPRIAPQSFDQSTFQASYKVIIVFCMSNKPLPLKYLSWKLGTSELNSKKPASLLPVIFIPPHFRSPTWQWYYIHTYILHTTYHFIRLINFYPGERLNAPIIFRELQPEWRKTF